MMFMTAMEEDSDGHGDDDYNTDFLSGHCVSHHYMIQTMYYSLLISSSLPLYQDNALWSCLATMAAYDKELGTAEIAYAALDAVSMKDIVYLIYCIKHM